MSYLIKNMHFIVIHVPIAMLLFSFIFDLLALAVKRKEWHSAGLLCLIVGAGGAVAAVITGPEGERNPLFPRHELFGKLTMALAIVLVLIRIWVLWKKKVELGRSVIYLAGALVLVGLVTYTGHLGGQMVHPDRSQFLNGNFPQRDVNGGSRGQGGEGGQNFQGRQGGPNGQNGQTGGGRTNGQGGQGSPNGQGGQSGQSSRSSQGQGT